MYLAEDECIGYGSHNLGIFDVVILVKTPAYWQEYNAVRSVVDMLIVVVPTQLHYIC